MVNGSDFVQSGFCRYCFVTFRRCIDLSMEIRTDLRPIFNYSLSYSRSSCEFNHIMMAGFNQLILNWSNWCICVYWTWKGFKSLKSRSPQNKILWNELNKPSKKANNNL